MLIRKEFRVESAHIVRNCTSERCSHSVHGHSAVIEVVLEGKTLDNAGMVYDFGLMKGTIKQLIDSTDHCYLLCTKDDPEFCNGIRKFCARYVELPFNPSAECLSMWYFKMIQKILDHTNMNNGEGNVKVKAVRYHETTTGWAECNEEDVKTLFKPEWEDVKFSGGIVKDWSPELAAIIFRGDKVDNPVIKQQIKL